MRISVRVFDSQADGRKRAVLVNQNGPLFWPNVFAVGEFVNAGMSFPTVQKLLYTLGMVEEWAEARGLSYDERLLDGDLLAIDEIEDLAYFLRLSRASQKLEVESRGNRRPSKIVRLDQVRGGFRGTPEALSASAAEGAIRCRWVAQYTEFLIDRRLGTLARRKAESAALAAHGRRIIDRLKELAPRAKHSSEDETLEGLSIEVVEALELSLKPGSDLNPFTPGFHQRRNYLIWRLFIETGMRRSELVYLKVQDIDYSSFKVAIRRSKSLPRTVSISRWTGEQFHHFILADWSKIPRADRAHGYLITSPQGCQLHPSSINLIFTQIATKIPGVPEWTTPHSLRRTWNDRFSERLNAIPVAERFSAAEEMAIRNRLQGWAAESQMSLRYARRFIRQKADEIAERLANSIVDGD